MRRSGLSLALPLILNACTIAPPVAPHPGLAAAPADSVVMLSTGALPPDATATPLTVARKLSTLSERVLPRYSTPRTGQRLPAPTRTPVPAVRPDSADARRPTGESSASPNSGGSVHVRGYYRRDGTYVRPHTRSRPGSRRRNQG